MRPMAHHHIRPGLDRRLHLGPKPQCMLATRTSTCGLSALMPSTKPAR
jgi:hypothetical protein